MTQFNLHNTFNSLQKLSSFTKLIILISSILLYKKKQENSSLNKIIKLHSRVMLIVFNLTRTKTKQNHQFYDETFPLLIDISTLPLFQSMFSKQSQFIKTPSLSLSTPQPPAICKLIFTLTKKKKQKSFPIMYEEKNKERNAAFFN